MVSGMSLRRICGGLHAWVEISPRLPVYPASEIVRPVPILKEKPKYHVAKRCRICDEEGVYNQDGGYVGRVQ